MFDSASCLLVCWGLIQPPLSHLLLYCIRLYWRLQVLSLKSIDLCLYSRFEATLVVSARIVKKNCSWRSARICFSCLAAGAFDEIKNDDLGAWKGDNHETRIKTDSHAAKVHRINEEIVDTMRSELAQEPMITGRRCGMPA